MREAIIVRKKLAADDLRRMAKTAKEAERERKLLFLADTWEDEARRIETTDDSSINK
jgi:hypothetical protein